MAKHECDLCENPYPYMCAECSAEEYGPASSRKHKPTMSMGKEFMHGLKVSIGKPEATCEVIKPKINISSGEDVFQY